MQLIGRNLCPRQISGQQEAGKNGYKSKKHACPTQSGRNDVTDE
jgi:hypothetical protein